MRRAWLVVLLVFVVAFSSAAMASAETLIVAQGADPVTLDPHGQNDQPSARVRVQIYETLVNHGYDLDIVPGLAKSWEQIDEVTWEFKLQEGVRFHNGDLFTAADVKYSFDRIKELPSPAAFLIDEVSEVVVVDPYTVQIVLKQPFAPILAHLAHPSNAIVNRRSVEEAGDAYGTQVAVGTGPFEFVEWVAGSHVELKRNENYWGEKAKVETLIIRGIPENTVRAIELETGGVDIAYNIAPIDELRLTGTPGLILDKYETLSTSYIGFNVAKEPFNNPLVRQAINYALDVDAVVDYIYSGQAIPVTGPLPPLVWASKTDLPGYDFDPEKAKQLLAEAGYPNGFKTSIWTNDNPLRMQIAEMFQADLAEIGVDVEVLIVPWATYLEDTAAGKHDMFILGWVTVTADPDYGLWALFHSSQFGNAGNRSFYANPRVDELLELGRSEADPEKRAAIYAEAQALIVEDAPWAFLIATSEVNGLRDNIEGFVPHPAGHHKLSTVVKK
ncbi:glutathione ABC transporter substrate-binding protein [Candidatus Darwinibacter acetoxidans]|nr:glutathione ABC transporter substrate-binding protein [Bacillota bacterium]